MKIATMSLYIGLLLGETTFEGHAYEGAKMKQANEFYQPAFQIEETEFPMFPREQEVDYFPNSIDESETDPQVLKEYYESVAQAYRTWGERQKDIVNACKEKAFSHQEQLFWKGTKSSANSLTQASAQAVSYYKNDFQNQNQKLQILEKKKDFYHELAENYKFFTAS